jgi:outer membrane protein OmpA-like peptidoglycan-associated protein
MASFSHFEDNLHLCPEKRPLDTARPCHQRLKSRVQNLETVMTREYLPNADAAPAAHWVRRTRLRLALTVSASALAASLLLAAGHVSAQQDIRPSAEPTAITPAAQLPRAGEMRLNIKMNGTSAAFTGAMEPVAREQIPFADGEYSVGQNTREAIATLQQKMAASKGKTTIIVAYHADEMTAYRRARAVRGEMIERFQVDPATMIATGRTVPEHTSGLTVVDVHTVDPASCTGCGNATFRTLAYDSGTVRLVTLIPEILADQGAKPVPAVTVARPAAIRQIIQAAPTPRPTTAPAQATRPAPAVVDVKPAPVRQILRAAPAPEPTIAPAQAVKRAPVTRPAAATRAEPTDKDYVSPQEVKRLQERTMALASGSCPRPRIIIDDYYPGGPLVPCKPVSR